LRGKKGENSEESGEREKKRLKEGGRRKEGKRERRDRWSERDLKESYEPLLII